MMQKKQLGSATVMLIVAAIVVTTVGLLLWERNSLKNEVSELTSSLSAAEVARDNAINKQEQLNNELATERKLSEASKEQAMTHQNAAKALQKQLDGLIAKFPKPLAKQDDAPVTEAQQLRSSQRIGVLWAVYCLDAPATAIECKKGEVK